MIWWYVFGNIVVLFLIVIVFMYSNLLEGLVLIEIVFVWLGFGLYLIGVLLNVDMNVVFGVMFVIGVMFIIVNLLIDVLYCVFDLCVC